jgi:protein SCO1/2
MLKKIRWIAYGGVGVLLLGWALFWTGLVTIGPNGSVVMGGALRDGISVGGVTIGGPFALIDGTGKAVTDADFRGRWMLVYFGYTFCPDVCPTELQSVSTALDLLGPLAARVVPVFITVDPERDTPAVMAEYVKLFDPRLIGLTGSAAQVAAATRAYRVYAQRVDTKTNTDYLMNHSSFIYLMGPDGRFVALFRQGMAPQEIATAIQARLAGAG